MHLSRRDFLTRAGVATAALRASPPAHGRQQPPAREGGSVWQRPPKQQGNSLNLILIVADTFRRDNLECYGSRWIECPNLNKFAKDSIIFEDAYPEGMPTIPVRRTLVTGRRVFPLYYYRQHEPVQLPGWHPLYNEDVTLSETLLEAGYIPALISDVPHLQRPGQNFHRGYRVYEWIRGQEIDYYGTSPRTPLDVSDIVPEEYLRQLTEADPGARPRASNNLREFLSQYKANRQRWQQDGESLIQLVAEAAVHWLKQNHDQRPFFLHIEAFDPHEPWDPPPHFLAKYMPGAKGYSWIEPPYANIKLSEEAKQRMRANYAAETACVDYWLGKVFDTIGELGLFDDSIVAFLSDHGTLLGEQDQFLKGPERLRGQVTHIPLLLRMPRKEHAGKRVSGFVQTPDLMPTLLPLLGLRSPSRVTGSDLWPLALGQTRSLRDFAVTGYGWIAAIRTAEWNYSQVWRPEAYKEIYRPQLYNLTADPEELDNVAEKYPDTARKLAAQLRAHLDAGQEMTRGSFFEKESLDIGQVYVKDAR